MQLTLTVLSALAATVAGQSLTQALNASTDLSQLTTLISQYPALVQTLSNATNITILAPSNQAIAALLNSTPPALLSNADAVQAILSYHVLKGSYPASSIKSTPAFVPTLLNNTAYANVTGGQVVEAITQGSSVEIFSGLLSKSNVTMANVNFTGGIIHVIDKVLSVPQNISYTAQQAGLSALVGALTKANLGSALQGLKDVTVFAPSNAAFQAIGSATGNLTSEQLASILQYHVINGTVGYSSKLANGTTLKTLGGGDVTVRVQNGTVYVNSAKVTTPDVLVSNGVVHVIDNVLNPNNTSAAPSGTASSQPVAFSGASSASDNPLTSGVAAPATSLGAAPTAAASAASSAAGGASSSSKSGVAMPMKTGAIGMAALFAGAGVFVNA